MFLLHLPVPVRHVVKSFEVVIIPFNMLKTHASADCRYPLNLSFKPAMTLKFCCTSKGEQKTFQVSIYSVHMLVSEVKLSQTFIR